MKRQILLLLTTIFTLGACTQQFTVGGADSGLIQRSVTEASDVVVFPDDNPSIPDGKVVWEKMNCAECHSGAEPFNKEKMAKDKPLDQYMLLTYGHSGTKHPALKDKLSRRQIWDLVFYSRSLSSPPLSDEEWAKIDPVFGANCAVCHGKRGHGDGPLARNLQPVPANFHQFGRFYDRDDDMLYDHIANGIKWTGMPNFLGKVDSTKNVKFDEAYIRQLVKYIRAFHSSNKATLADSPAADKGTVGQ